MHDWRGGLHIQELDHERPPCVQRSTPTNLTTQIASSGRSSRGDDEGSQYAESFDEATCTACTGHAQQDGDAPIDEGSHIIDEKCSLNLSVASWAHYIE